ncbi:MAG: transposase [Bacteroidales bacterium]|nr:transposase [Bacteroidales bacterium]
MNVHGETICKLYRIRWQIELVFKVWKSILHIDQTHKMKEMDSSRCSM